MKTQRKLIVAMSLYVTALLFTVAEAACTQVDMTGTWHVFGLAGDTYSRSFEGSFRCKLTVSSTGSLVPSTSTCTIRDDVGVHYLTIGGGKMVVSSTCAITGNIQVCQSGACNTEQIQAGQLARDKNTFSLVGYLQIDPTDVFHLNGVKQ